MEKKFFPVLILLYLIVYLFFVSAQQPSSQEPDFKALLINSYHYGYEWSDSLMDAVFDEFSKSGLKIDLSVEFMDTKRTVGKQNLKAFYDLIKAKYQHHKINILIASDDNAYQFLLKHREDLFPGTPAVFLGINDFDPDQLAAHRAFVTGLIQKTDVYETAEVALIQNPKADHILFIHDGSPTGIGNEMAFRRALPRLKKKFPNVRGAFLSKKEVSTEEMLDKVSRLPENYIALISHWTSERFDALIPYPESFQMISDRCAVPLYSTNVGGLGHGIVGGKVTTGDPHGRTAARMAIKILQGVSPADIPIVTESVNRYFFDYRQLKRWNIDLGLLPENCTIIHQPVDYFKTYAHIILPFLVFLGLQMVLIFILIINIQKRKQAENVMRKLNRHLKKSEERLELALAGANDGVWDWNVKNQIIHFDSRYYTMAGYEPYEFPGKFEEWEKRVHPDDINEAKLAVAQTQSGEIEMYDTEFRFLCKDGRYMWIRSRGKIVTRDEEGNPMRFIGTHSDITDWKKAETALQASEQLLSNIIESMHEGVLVLDTSYKCTSWNRRMEETSNVPREKMLGKIPWEVFPFLKGDVENAIKRAMKGETVDNFEMKYRLPDGGDFLTKESYIPLKNSGGYINGVVGVIEDITEQKKADEELHRLRNYLSNIIDSMPSALVGVDADGHVTQWNKTAEKTTGVTVDDAVGKKFSDVIPWLSTEMERVSKSIRTRQIIRESKKSRLRNNKLCYEDVTIYPLITNGVEGAVIRIDDVTKKVKLEEMMVQSEKMLSVGGLAAGMAHEINNPLAGLMQTAGVLASRLGSRLDIPANRRAAEEAGTSIEAVHYFMEARSIPRMLDAIITSGRRVAEIVNNMLNFARKSDAVVSTHGLEELLDRTLELAATDYDLKKQHDFRRIKIERDYAESLPVVPCEGAKIQQVLLNIFRNGAEAMQEAGTENPTFTLRTRVDEDRVRVEIEDNGPGMDESTRKRVFEPFFTTKAVGVGTGLGLSVSFFIITENHGGEMSVASTLGKGTTFIIRLPIEREEKMSFGSC